MLSDEEKKELQELINLLYNGHISQYGKRKLEAYIKKQQTEIEELKEGYKIQEHNYQVAMEEIEQRCEDKIKSRIEELDEEIKVKREIAKNPMDRVSGRLLTDSIVELEKTKKVLQSLLEKE